MNDVYGWFVVGDGDVSPDVNEVLGELGEFVFNCLILLVLFGVD